MILSDAGRVEWCVWCVGLACWAVVSCTLVCVEVRLVTRSAGKFVCVA